MNFNWKKNTYLETSSRRWRARLDCVNIISRRSIKMLKGHKTLVPDRRMTGMNGRYWQEYYFKQVALEDVFDESFSIFLNYKVDFGLQIKYVSFLWSQLYILHKISRHGHLSLPLWPTDMVPWNTDGISLMFHCCLLPNMDMSLLWVKEPSKSSKSPILFSMERSWAENLKNIYIYFFLSFHFVSYSLDKSPETLLIFLF